MRFVIVLLGMLTLSRVLEKRGAKLAGNVMGVPYDFRTPNLEKVRERIWNPADSSYNYTSRLWDRLVHQPSLAGKEN